MNEVSPEDYCGHTPMSDAEARAFIAGSRWIFAKTMPKIPHEYTLRREAASDEAFARMIKHIRQFGYDQRWGRHNHRYLDLDGWRYWTMGYLTSATILINRARLNPDESERSRQMNPIPFMAKYWPLLWNE